MKNCYICGAQFSPAESGCPECLQKRIEKRQALEKEPADPVNRPSHYTQGKIECIDAIESALTPEQFIGFLRGTQIKYAWRAGLKDPSLTCQDLDKQIWYARREIEFLTKKETKQ